MLNMVNNSVQEKTEGFEYFLLNSEYVGLMLDEQEFSCAEIKKMLKTGEIISASQITDNKYIVRTRKKGLQTLEIL